MSYQITTAVIGIVLASVILYMVRRDHLHGPYAYWWLAVAAATVIFGVSPQLIDRLARWAGVTYSPALLFSVAIALMLLKMLKADIEISRHERRIRRLAQHVAIVDDENRRLREALEAERSQPPERRTAAR